MRNTVIISEMCLLFCTLHIRHANRKNVM